MLLEQIKNYEIFRPKCDYTKEILHSGVPYHPWHCIRYHVASLLADTYKESLPPSNGFTTARYIQSLSQDVVQAAEKLMRGSLGNLENPGN